MKTRNKAQRFNFKQSQILVEKSEDINGKVKILIAKLNALTEDYYERAFIILNQIKKLRQIQFKTYGYSHLSREKDINLTAHQIAYILGYRYVSNYTKGQIDKGNLKSSTALFLIKQNMKFREPKYQDKVVKMYLDGKTNTSVISHLSKETLLDNVIDDKIIGKANKKALSIYTSMKEHLRDIRMSRNLFSDRKIIREIVGVAKKLVEEAELILKVGEKMPKEKEMSIGKRANAYSFLDEK